MCVGKRKFITGFGVVSITKFVKKFYMFSYRHKKALEALEIEQLSRNYFDLLAEMPSYCFLFETFYFVFLFI